MSLKGCIQLHYVRIRAGQILRPRNTLIFLVFFYELPFLHWHIFFRRLPLTLCKKSRYITLILHVLLLQLTTQLPENVFFLRNIFGTLIDTYYDILNKVDFFQKKNRRAIKDAFCLLLDNSIVCQTYNVAVPYDTEKLSHKKSFT